jgi:1-deoxy-D-xylulose-5-phosphate reductoisomerase
MVRFTDSSVIAQLGTPDMRGAIGYALNYPQRKPLPVENLDLAKIGSLNFEEVDDLKFPVIDLAYNSIKRGDLFGAALNAAKEIALDKFIAGEIKFLDITSLVQQTLDSNELIELEGRSSDSIDDVMYADFLSRNVSGSIKLN